MLLEHLNLTNGLRQQLVNQEKSIFERAIIEAFKQKQSKAIYEKLKFEILYSGEKYSDLREGVRTEGL